MKFRLNFETRYADTLATGHTTHNAMLYDGG